MLCLKGVMHQKTNERNDHMIRVFDAFSGIGGFRSGLERVGGFEFVAWCEVDKFAQKAYRALYDTGGEQFYENIRNIDAGELADFDLLVGGFPCQPFSVCGARKGFADERGDLFFELARILKDKIPRYFLFENVPGLMGIDSGRTFAKIIETLCELGYCVEWRVHPKGTSFGRIPAPIIFPKSEREYILQDVLELIVPAKYWLSEEATAKIAGNLNS